ncbi:MAG: cytochrome c biogenesis protein DipZ, partial [Candidatus Berkiella sp.]
FEKDKTQLYHFPASLTLNQWALSGLWKIEGEKALSQGNECALKFHFKAKKVFLVMGSKANHPIFVNILLNNQPVTKESGIDVIDSRIQVNEYRLYELISQPVNSQGMLEIRVNDSNLEIYAFTFG